MTKLFVKRLTNLDFSFLDAQRGLVGESWLLDIELSGQLDEQGMVLDFGIVKSLVRNYVEQNLDHRLLVPVQYEGCDVLELDKQLEIVFYQHNGQSITHRSVHQAVAKIPTDSINIGSIERFLLEQLQPLLPDNVEGLELKLYTEPDLDESYQYSHGLSKHLGNCQRIAHGHRSQLQIFVDNQRSEQWERYWLEQWQDIYIGTFNHLFDAEHNEENYYHFKYLAPQGNFFLKLPQKKCYLIDSESTVENIAQHLAEQIAAKVEGKTVKVIAYEGIGKGAVAVSRNKCP